MEAPIGAPFVFVEAALLFVMAAPPTPTELPALVEAPPVVEAPPTVPTLPPVVEALLPPVPVLVPVVELSPPPVPALVPVVELLSPTLAVSVPVLVPPMPPVPPVPPLVGCVGPLNFHQLNLNRSPLPPVNLRNRSCLPAPPLTSHVFVVQSEVPDTSQVPSSVPSWLSRWSSIEALSPASDTRASNEVTPSKKSTSFTLM